MINQILKAIKKLPFQLIIFIFYVGCFTLFINSANSVAYGFIAKGVEAIVEKKEIFLNNTLGSSTDYFLGNPTWDLFSHNGKAYVNKQPGVIFIGTIPYFFIHKTGLTIKENISVVTGLIALFTSALMTSAVSIMMFNIAFNITKNIRNSFFISLFTGFGTLLFPYSTIPHHDIYATFFLFLGFYLLFSRYHLYKRNSSFLIILGGLVTGFSFFNSFNVATIILVLFIYVLSHKNKKDIILFIFSLLIGFLPTLIYNATVFGHPFNFAITEYCKFHKIPTEELSIKNLLLAAKVKTDAYLFSQITGIGFYSPVFLISYLGLFLLHNKYSIERTILLLTFPIQFFQPLIQVEIGGFGLGWCQYGPRYLLECTPFVLVGLSGFFQREEGVIKTDRNSYHLYQLIILMIGFISILICSLGSFGTTYCNFYENAFMNYLPKLLTGEIPKYNFTKAAFTIIIFAMFLFFIKYSYKCKCKKRILSTLE
jgi:hypothetical protein